VKIYESEELLWQRRGGENWLLKGDANTSYFHTIANGRKRKCLIRNLVEGDRVIENKEELKSYITYFYKNLFGGGQDPGIHLSEEFWRDRRTCGEDDNQWLISSKTLYHD
jgi:hypothetical protein